jgi:hypothetical protein
VGVRLVRAACREVYDVARAHTPTHRRLRDRLAVVVIATLGVNVLCAVVAFLVERHAHQSDVKSFGSALFWTSTQLLTVSSSVKNPISAGGRVLDVLMEAYAITVVATLAGSLGAFFQKRGEERADEDASR